MIYFGFIFIFFIRKHCILLQTVLSQDGGSYQKKLLKLVVCGFYWQLWRKAAAWKHCQPGQHAGMCKCCLGERDKAPCGTGLWLPFAVDFIWFCVLYLSVNHCQSIFESAEVCFFFPRCWLQCWCWNMLWYVSQQDGSNEKSVRPNFAQFSWCHLVITLLTLASLN